MHFSVQLLPIFHTVCVLCYKYDKYAATSSQAIITMMPISLNDTAVYQD